MQLRRRLLTVIPLLVGATLLSGAAALAQDDPAPPATFVPDNPFGLDPIDGGEPIPDPSVQIVDRWTITPEGANDPNAVSTRDELSYTGEPGSVITDGVTVFNLGNQPLMFYVYGTDAVNRPDGTFALLTRDSEPTDVGSWVTLGQEAITISPGRASTIPVTINIPPNASPGDHVGAIVASAPATGEDDDGNRIELDRGVGTRLYVRVAGALRPELSVADLSVDYHAAANPFGGGTTVTYRVHNTGNVRLDGTYLTAVAGPFGIGRQTLDPVAFDELLPGQSIEVTGEFDGVPALGWVTAEVELTAEGPGGADAGDRASANGIAIPVTILLILLLLVAGWYAARRIRSHRAAPAEFVPATPDAFEPDREPQLQ